MKMKTHTLADAILSELSELLAEQLGLHFPRERWGDLERGLLAAAHEFKSPGLEQYAQQILAGPLTHHHIEILASHLTIGETYFFRDRASFEALELNILPALIRSRRNSGRFLRIWSAGCCTGEEPYSIAMLLDRLLPADEQWHVTLLATDINPKFLRKAMAGVYGDWSFRGTPSWLKDRYFTKTGHGRFELHPRIRKMVTFSHLNLAEDAYPSLTNNTNAMDLIFCRNVLMYFTESHMHDVIGNLHRALVAGGSLNVSPSEASGRLFSRFTPMNFSDTIFYQKPEGDGIRPARPEPLFPGSGFSYQDLMPVTAAVKQEMVRLSQETPGTRLIPETSYLDASDKEAIDPAPGESDTGDDATQLYAEAELCANQGRLAEAASWCEQAIDRDRLNPQSHYLLATIMQELGKDDAAEVALKRALYLDPGFVLASFAFGNLRLSQGRYKEAERHLRNVLALLQRCDPQEIVSGADGLLVGRLREIIASVLDSLPRTGELSGHGRIHHEKSGVHHHG